MFVFIFVIIKISNFITPHECGEATIQNYCRKSLSELKKSGQELQKSGQTHRRTELSRSEAGGFFEEIIKMSRFFETQIVC